jgi:hypothetical protein
VDHNLYIQTLGHMFHLDHLMELVLVEVEDIVVED